MGKEVLVPVKVKKIIYQAVLPLLSEIKINKYILVTIFFNVLITKLYSDPYICINIKSGIRIKMSWIPPPH